MSHCFINAKKFSRTISGLFSVLTGFRIANQHAQLPAPSFDRRFPYSAFSRITYSACLNHHPPFAASIAPMLDWTDRHLPLFFTDY